MGSVAEWSKALDLSIFYLTPSGENPREFEPRRYQCAFFPHWQDRTSLRRNSEDDRSL